MPSINSSSRIGVERVDPDRPASIQEAVALARERAQKAASSTLPQATTAIGGTRHDLGEVLAQRASIENGGRTAVPLIANGPQPDDGLLDPPRPKPDDQQPVYASPFRALRSPHPRQSA